MRDKPDRSAGRARLPATTSGPSPLPRVSAPANLAEGEYLWGWCRL